MMLNVHWINWRGLTIRNVYQREANVEPKGIVGFPFSNMHFDRMIVHDIGGCGWYMHSAVGVTGEGYGWDKTGYIPYDTSSYINCDTYQCCDTFAVNSGNTPGNMADGFKTIAYPGAVLSYEGCRSWHNSDDGFDLPTNTSYVKVSNCWSFNHNYTIFGAQPDGNGFKMAGGSSEGPSTTNGANKIFENNIMTDCSIGLYYMEDDGLSGGGIYRSICDVNNNFIYKCDLGMQLRVNGDYPNDMQARFRNNIIYGTTTKDAGGRPYNLSVDVLYTESNNTWDYADDTEIGSLSHWKPATDVTVTDADFVMNPLDDAAILAQLTAQRKADGSLPDITFGRLAAGSDLIDAGVNVGLPFSGSAPDIGVFETDSGESNVIPVYLNSTIDEPAPSIIEMTYNLTLSNIAPVPSAFKVQVNSITRNVNSVEIKGNQVELTLASPVVSGDIVTTTYIKPVTNPLQALTGTKAENISNKLVTNNIEDILLNIVKEDLFASKISFYPNPAHELLNIEFNEPSPESYDIKVISLSGKVFFEDRLDIGSLNVKIPLRLNPGLYLLQLSSGQRKVQAQKLIVY